MGTDERVSINGWGERVFTNVTGERVFTNGGSRLVHLLVDGDGCWIDLSPGETVALREIVAGAPLSAAPDLTAVQGESR